MAFKFKGGVHPDYRKSPEVPVTVRYMSGTNLIASYQEVCPINATTTVRADPSIYEGSYTLQGDDHVNVKVDANGNCKPIGDHNAKKIDGVIAQLTALGGYLDQVYGVQSAFVIPNN